MGNFSKCPDENNQENRIFIECGSFGPKVCNFFHVALFFLSRI